MEKENIYIIRKLVKAKSIEEAIKKEKKIAPLEVVLSRKKSEEPIVPAMGFAPSERGEAS